MQAELQPADVVRQKIIDTIRRNYDDEKTGLCTIAQEMLGETLEPPRPKVTVMLIGNHSSGKSSFVNWFVDHTEESDSKEPNRLVQRESAAMETTGFTWIVRGRCRDTHKGSATLKAMGYLRELADLTNVQDNLVTEVVPLRERASQRGFAMVDLVDTPGLTDGGLIYPYDIDNVLVKVADKVDLIFVFFDPHGQALCERTRRVVRAIASHPQNKIKLTYVLTKIDTFKSDKEKSKVMVQLSQSLTQAHEVSNGSFGNHALTVLGIFLPHKADANLPEEHRKWNEIDELTNRIRAKLKENTQNHCDQFEKHATKLLTVCNGVLASDLVNEAHNERIDLLRSVSFAFVWTLPVLLLCYLLHAAQAALLPNAYKEEGSVMSAVLVVVRLLGSVPAMIDSNESSVRVLGVTLIMFLLLLCVTRFINQWRRPKLANADVAKRKTWRSHLKELLAPTKGAVAQQWQSFLNLSVDSDKGQLHPVPEY